LWLMVMPEIIKINDTNKYDVIKEIAKKIIEGKIIAIPTDTCYGLAVDATSIRSVKRLFYVKKRPISKPVSIFLSGKEEIGKYAVLEGISRKVINLFPDRITIIFKAARSNVVEDYIIKNNTIGIRVPLVDIPRLMCKFAGRPITATSANVRGEPPIYNSTELYAWDDIDYILDYGMLKKVDVSTVIDISEDKIKILREGAISISELELKLKKISLDNFEIVVSK